MSRRRWRSSPSSSPGPAWPSSTSSADGAPRFRDDMAFLDLRNLRKSFGASTVVQDFTLGVDKGEFVTFLGPSGCGKTTILRMIAGFETPTSGSISFDGTDVTAKPASQRRVGMVFQSYALF